MEIALKANEAHEASLLSMVLIIYCHPSKTSHNYKILEVVTNILKKKKTPFEVLDLYAMNFDAYLNETEYQRMRTGPREVDADVKALQEKISSAKSLIFIYPTWWYNMPAKLKGFIDRVFTARFAYRFFKVPQIFMLGADILSRIPGIRYLMQPLVVKGFLKGKKAFIFRTYGGPKAGKRIFGSSARVLEQVVLRYCGITNITVHELFNVDKEIFTDDDEAKYLKTVESIVKTRINS